MSEPVSPILFWPERKASERLRRGFASGPAQLAERLLVAFAMQVKFKENAERSHSFHVTRTWSDPIRYGASTSRGLMVHRTLFGEEMDDYIYEDVEHYHASSFLRHHDSAALIWGKLAAEDEPESELENIGTLINRAAELLAVRHQHSQHESIRQYVSSALEAKRAADQAEVDRNLTGSSKNRQAMAALMAHDWLGYRLLHELANSRPRSLSDLVSKAEAEADEAAAVLANLVRGGLIETQGDAFACTSRGNQVLESLQTSIESAGPLIAQEGQS